MYFCQKHTDEKLQDISINFSIEESDVSQANRQVTQKIEKDKKLKRKYVFNIC